MKMYYYYLKFSGDVANEVETEQIVVDSTISNLDKANVTSFVQIRGSVPGGFRSML